MDLVGSTDNILRFRGSLPASKQKLGLRKLPDLFKKNGICDRKPTEEYSIAKKPETT